MPIFTEKDMNICIPKLVRVKQYFEDEHIIEIEETVRKQLMSKDIKKKIIQGQSVAIAVGSRGIDNIEKIVKATVDILKSLGAEPFIFPAMGSHGGGTVSGQLEILNSYGINEQNMGVSINASVRVIRIGTTENGIPVVIDEVASKADMIVIINRIKEHTDFSGTYESGLCKMLAIGLGKHEGCTRYHKEGFDLFPILMPEIANIVIKNSKIGFGLAIIENAYGKTALIKAVTAENIIIEEPGLLAIAKKFKAKIMIPEIDLLIVNEIGKDISGGGMDSKITGILGCNEKWRLDGFKGPKIKKVFVLGISSDSHGNANGIGLADFMLKSVFSQIDFTATYANAIASGVSESAKIPLMLDTINDGIIASFVNSSYDDISQLKIVRIKNTRDLEEIEVSENLLCFVNRGNRMEII